MDRQRVHAGRAVVVGHGPPGDLAEDVRVRADDGGSRASRGMSLNMMLADKAGGMLLWL